MEGLLRLGEAALDALWIPVLVWTLVALPVYLLGRALQHRQPGLAHSLVLGMLCALPLGMVVSGVILPARQLAADGGIGGLVATGALPAIMVTVSPPESSLYVGLGALTLLVAGMALFRLGRLGCQARALYRMHRRLRPHVQANRTVADLARRLGIRRRVRLVSSPGVRIPLTYGVVRPVIVLPASMDPESEAGRLALLHELVHVCRNDMIWHGLASVIAALFGAHPLVARMMRFLDVTREQACDRVVLVLGTCAPRAYARLLFRLLHEAPSVATPSLGMAASSHIKTRIEAMKTYPRTHFPPRLALLAGLLVLLGGTILVACTDIVEETPQAEGQAMAGKKSEGSSTGETFVIVERMPELIGGLASIQSKIRYPEIAKKAGVEGTVIVQFTVDEKGRVVDPEVVQGIGAGCDEEALRVIKEARFIPGMQNGEVAPVRISVPIRFKLHRE